MTLNMVQFTRIAKPLYSCYVFYCTIHPIAKWSLVLSDVLGCMGVIDTGIQLIL